MQTVLIVDDEPDILETLKGLLETSLDDVRVVTVASGQEGIDVLERDNVDLILSDYRMPGMNGLEFLEKAREVAPGVPRTLITAYPDLDVAIRAINEVRIDQFIQKPFDSAAFLDHVRAALFRRRLDKAYTGALRGAMGRPEKTA